MPNETACGRCDWAGWAKEHGGYAAPTSVDAQRQLLDQHGFDASGELLPLQPGHAVVAKCRSCGIQKAKQSSDVAGWGCHCTRVTSSGGVGKRKEDGRVDPYRYLRAGCSICRGQATRKQNGRQTLASVLSEIADQWHPTRNGTKFTPETVGPNSNRSFWWKADCCGYEWEDSVKSRDKYQRWRCPQCKTILHSFGWQDPGLPLNAARKTQPPRGTCARLRRPRSSPSGSVL